MTFHIIPPLAGGQASQDVSQDVSQDAKRVTALLTRLEALKKEVAKARQALAPLEANLALAEKEYQDKISPLRRRVRGLQSEIYEIENRIARINSEPESDEHDMSDEHDDLTMFGRDQPSPDDSQRSTVKPIDLNMLEKDKLLEHAYRVLDAMMNPNDAQLIGQLTGWSRDPTMTLGDLLEELSWGTVWLVRSQPETVADQHERLATWQQALIKQQHRLNRSAQRMRRDRRYRLWQQRKKGSQAWQSYLEQEAKREQQTIKQLQRRLEELEEEWHQIIIAQ